MTNNANKDNSPLINENYYSLKNNDIKLLSAQEEFELAKTIAETNANISYAISHARFVIEFILQQYEVFKENNHVDFYGEDKFVLNFKDLEKSINISNDDDKSTENLELEDNLENKESSGKDVDSDELKKFNILVQERFEKLKKLYEQSKICFNKNGPKSALTLNAQLELQEYLSNFIFTPNVYEAIESFLDSKFSLIQSKFQVFKEIIKTTQISTELFHHKEFLLNPLVKKSQIIYWLTLEDLKNDTFAYAIDDKRILIEDACYFIEQIKAHYQHSFEDAIDIYNRIKTEYYKGKNARERMIKANIRLVMHEARKFSKDNDTFNDLTQYGIFGLIKAIEKFDYTKKNKLSTYATWWIKQYINRALDTDFKSIRLPVNKEEKIKKINKFSFDFFNEHGREPRNEEIAEAIGLTTQMVTDLKFFSKPTISLNDPIKNDKDDDSLSLESLCEDTNIKTPTQHLENENLVTCLNKALAELTYQEADIIKKRFGLENEDPVTLEKIAETYNVKAERIRQIEAKTLRKLSHSSKFNFLRELLDEKGY